MLRRHWLDHLAFLHCRRCTPHRSRRFGLSLWLGINRPGCAPDLGARRGDHASRRRSRLLRPATRRRCSTLTSTRLRRRNTCLVLDLRDPWRLQSLRWTGGLPCSTLRVDRYESHDAHSHKDGDHPGYATPAALPGSRAGRPHARTCTGCCRPRGYGSRVSLTRRSATPVQMHPPYVVNPPLAVLGLLRPRMPSQYLLVTRYSLLISLQTTIENPGNGIACRCTELAFRISIEKASILGESRTRILAYLVKHLGEPERRLRPPFQTASIGGQVLQETDGLTGVSLRSVHLRRHQHGEVLHITVRSHFDKLTSRHAGQRGGGLNHSIEHDNVALSPQRPLALRPPGDDGIQLMDGPVPVFLHLAGNAVEEATGVDEIHHLVGRPIGYLRRIIPRCSSSS